MAENSAISWTDHTFNPWIGCTRISPACDGCYAAGLMGTAGRFGPARAIWGGPGKGDGTRSRTKDWSKPRKWQREAAEAMRHWREQADLAPLVGHPAPLRPAPVFVFCASLADVFDNAVPVEWRADLFSLIHATPNLTWLLLTKRPGNIVRLGMASDPDPDWRWPRNAAIGCTIANQEEADRDIPKLLAAKAVLNPAFAFLSMEPLLGPVDVRPWLPGDMGCESCDDGDGLARNRCSYTDIPREEQCPRNFAVFDYPEGPPDENGVPAWIAERRLTLDWIITGGETDQKLEDGSIHRARPADPDWYRSLRDQCAAAGVPFHFKQWGEWQPFMGQVPTSHNPRGVHHFSDALGAAPVFKLGKDVDPCTLDGVVYDARPEVRR